MQEEEYLFGIAAAKNDRLPCVQPRLKGCHSHERNNAEPFTTHSCFLNNFSTLVTAYMHSGPAVYMMPLVS